MAVNGLAHTAQLRRILGWHESPGYFSIKTVFFYGIAFILISPGIVHYNKAQQLAGGSVSRIQNEPGRICESMDIRNSLDSFSKLEKCEVIEGFLQILLFDSVNETELSKMSFPLLTEITDYLLLYRVNGLRSLGHLFPNLAVIRGQNMFLDNTFVIFEMSTLQEIGLYSLTHITRGSVRIDKNPSLCFVHTVDWERIVQDKNEINFVKSLKPENECPVCPSHIDGMTSENNSISISCPDARRTNSDIFEKDRFLCWNKKHCQKVCPSHCKACNSNGECCSRSCLACSDEDRNLCTVCLNYSIGFGRGKQCMENCPKGLVGYLDRRCISPEECRNMPKPIALHATSDPEKPYKVHKNSCILHCPSDHTDNYKDHTCDPCGGRCKKTCEGVNIDSGTVAKQLRGCTHIRGALEIQIRGGTNVTELEENLKMIEEISDYLKIVRSFSLISLNFLKSLRRIRGVNLEAKKFVFIVLDNQNLQELWDWRNRTLQIDRGTLYFHFNPKLCLNKIETLRQITGLQPFSDLEVASNSNGDKTACNITPLKVNVTNITNKSVTLKWKPFHLDDQRKLLAYIIYIREAPFKTVTLYDGRDACGLDDWRVVDVPNKEDAFPIDQLLPSLKPYTQYAFYVRTYTIEKNGSQSDIQYFRTLPSMPSPPVNLQVVSGTSDSLRVTWSPPLHPNGQITYYIVSGKKHENGYMFTEDCPDQKNKYFPPLFPKGEQSSIVTTAAPKKDTCQCDDKRQIRINIDEQEEIARITFEDKLHNEVYQKKSTKKKRSPPEFPKNANKLPINLNSQIQNVTENGTDIWESFNFPVHGQNNFTIKKLHHYTLYDINVQACRIIEGEDDKDSPCSSTSMKTCRTLSKPGADNIGKIQLTNQSVNAVTISWEQPDDPNGQIFRYSLEYRIIDNENSRPYYDCVNAKELNKTVVYTISNLYPGNYSLVVTATSSGGTGNSSTIYFYLEEPPSYTVLIVCVTLFVFLTVLFFLGWLYRKNLKDKERENRRLIQTVNPEYVPSVYIPDEWEVPRKKIDFIKELGQGSFGMVWEGLGHDIRGKPEIRCAVKTVNEHATDRERLEFLNEASVMKAFDTAHVVRLLGVVSQGQPTLVIMELMANGDLKSYLRSHRPDDPNLIKHPPSLKQILQMAIEIADGMAYLSAKKFVHRDLAARNCMVTEDLTVKIGDFGMTRDIYETDYYRKGTKGLLPVRWMAPESLKDGLFTSNSDVWSYGVVLWEMATLASQPYQGLSNDQVLRYVIDGGVMERPENCPDKLYTLMRYCWQHKPTSRPSFLKLCQLLLDDASPTFSKVSFYHSPAGVEVRASRPTPSPSQDDQTTPLRKVAEKLRGYTPTHSQDSDELDIDTHHQFPSISESGVGIITTANGYVSGCPTNGAATTQC